MASTRRLVVVRHAEAEQFAATDLDRTLTGAGRADALALGAWLAHQGITPDVAYVSGATRTRQTWAAIADGAGWAVEPFIDAGLYGTDEHGILELVHATLDRMDAAVVVGHNPAVGIVAQLLDDGAGSATGSVESSGFPTCTAAVLEVTGAWDDFVALGARLELFHVARA